MLAASTSVYVLAGKPAVVLPVIMLVGVVVTLVLAIRDDRRRRSELDSWAADRK